MCIRDRPEGIDFKEYFSDIVGVSRSNAPVEEVILKVSDKAIGYIVTKPLHESQSAVTTPLEDGYWTVSYTHLISKESLMICK